VLADFAAHWPGKFTNITNGVTPRRFLALANPGLCRLITDTIGDGWLQDLDRLGELEPYADDPGFLDAFRAVKTDNKTRLARLLEHRDGILIDPDSMFDVMVKRLHEYKRQILKLLHVITLYQRIRANPDHDPVPRVVLFGAKAAPGYWAAKTTIALINAVARVLAADPLVAGRLRIAFPANYNVTLSEAMIPAADLSEQISLAGKEASGTGNMKLALNGALTIGTLDGANVEIRDLVGDENFFLFGMTEPEVTAAAAAGHQPRPPLPDRPRPTPRAGRHRRRRLLRRRPRPVRAAGGRPARQRLLHGAGRLPVLHPGPGPRRTRLPRPARLDAQRRAERRPVRVLLQRPVHPRLPQPGLAHHTGAPPTHPTRPRTHRGRSGLGHANPGRAVSGVDAPSPDAGAPVTCQAPSAASYLKETCSLIR
jgi:hypothetical protein